MRRLQVQGFYKNSESIISVESQASETEMHSKSSTHNTTDDYYALWSYPHYPILRHLCCCSMFIRQHICEYKGQMAEVINPSTKRTAYVPHGYGIWYDSNPVGETLRYEGNWIGGVRDTL